MRVRRLLGAPGTRAHACPSRKTACGLAGTVILCGAGAAFLSVAGSIPARSQEAVGAASTPTVSAAASTPAAGATPANGTARRDEISRLGVAAMRGDYAAIEQLAKIAANAGGMNPDERKALYDDFTPMFADLGTEAGQGNAAALKAILWASYRTELAHYHSIAKAFGQAAAMGNAEALKPLLDPEDYGILPSSAVLALQPAVDAGNTRAIQALAAIAADPEGHSVWYMAATEVASAAAVGNTTAIDSLAALAANKGRDVRRVAIRALEVAAGKGHPNAQQALDRLPPTLRQEAASAASPPTVSAAASTPPAGAAPTEDKARRDGISRLGVAAMRGDQAALEQLDKIAATASGMNADQKAALDANLRRTFTALATEAGRGNTAALQAILRASHFDKLKGLQFAELEGLAVGALGKAALMGNAEALKPLLEPEKHGILRSSAVMALKPAADAGNTQAIEALAATAADRSMRPLWMLTAEGLASAAAAGNTTAIDSLGALAADKDRNIHHVVIRALEVAAGKGYPRAQQALHKVLPALWPEAVDATPADDKARGEAVSRLRVATMRGDYAGIEQLVEIVASDREMNADERAALQGDFRRTFALLGTEAGRGSATALKAILRALYFDELQDSAVQALGQAAATGNAEALQPLLHPENHDILLSSAVMALKPSADAGNTRAIEALAATVADQKLRPLWLLAAEGLASAASTGNTTAIDSLAALAADKDRNLRWPAIQVLELAADKGQPAAQQALHKLGRE